MPGQMKWMGCTDDIALKYATPLHARDRLYIDAHILHYTLNSFNSRHCSLAMVHEIKTSMRYEWEMDFPTRRKNKKEENKRRITASFIRWSRIFVFISCFYSHPFSLSRMVAAENLSIHVGCSPNHTSWLIKTRTPFNNMSVCCQCIVT